MHLGLVTLGDWLPDPHTGQRITEAARFRQFVDLGELAEELGFHAFHVGEHHFSEYALSSPTPVLAAVAERTTTLRLSTAVSLLPHHDPVRVAEDYATVDVLSGGRVELVGGRGVYQRHYRQFGQAWDDSEALLAEAVTLLRRLWVEEQVSWSGSLRPPLREVTVHPRPVQRPHPPIWLSASSPASVSRAVALGCPIVIPTVSTGVEAPPRLAEQYRDEWVQAGHEPAASAVALHVHCYVGDGSAEDARDEWRPHQLGYLRWVIDDVYSPDAPLPPHLTTLGEANSQAVCGDADAVVNELTKRLDAMGGADVLLIQSDQGALPWDRVRGSIERFASQVAPRLPG
jgi:alkanesulfonate monooxygenase SsuD/methylene tetrahydromethanopterin reductase-like flavin-dependent oxidoreductase (luciferase family)